MKKAIGQRIRELRRSKDYSQENMAAELDITPGAYAKIERGETDPSVTRLIQIAGILEVDVASFFREQSITELNIVAEPAAQYTTEPISRSEFKAVVNTLNQLKQELDEVKKQLALK
ncbi:MAG: helix-turn-helix domain-containing protein [Bacteroidota bacterium]